MYYLTHYQEYPIYEPAEGGYYYTGNEAVGYERLSKRKAIEKFNELVKEAIDENALSYTEYDTWKFYKANGRVFDSVIRKMYRERTRYIGDGESYVVERHLGAEKRGYEPYC